MKVLEDLATRPRFQLDQLPTLDLTTANAHPDGHPNSIVWLLWHTGRELDIQLSHLSGAPEVWRDYAARVGLGDEMGYGHTDAQAHAVAVDSLERLDALREYVAATLAATESYVASLSDASLDDVVDTNWTPAVTRGVRLVSIIDDAIQHLAQCHYIVGMASK